jgi:hypothetical protein
MPGVLQIVRDGSFLAVLAQREEQAIWAADALAEKAIWQNDTTLPPMEALFDISHPNRPNPPSSSTAPLATTPFPPSKPRPMPPKPSTPPSTAPTTCTALSAPPPPSPRWPMAN